jgi:hypothetical protein
MNSEEMKKFMSDYNELRDKYPMVAFDAWTPVDYAYIIADIKGEEEPTDINWNDDSHVTIARTLMDEYDADSGLNNDSIRESIERIVKEG